MAKFPVSDWSSLVIRGAVAMLLGVFMSSYPGMSLMLLAFVCGTYFLVDGALSVTGAWVALRAEEPWISLLIEGIAGITAAVVTFAWPGLTAAVLIPILLLWATITGIFEAAVRLRRHVTEQHFWVVGISAALVVGMILMSMPLSALRFVSMCVGGYVFIFGTLLITTGLHLRSRMKAAEGAAADSERMAA